MKRKYLLLVSFLALLTGFSSCKKDGFLDNKSTSELNKDIVFADSAYTMDFLIGLYLDAGFDVDGNMYLSEATDEAETRWPGAHNFINQMIAGSYGTQFYNKIGATWDRLYANIRRANIFLQEVDKSPLSARLKESTKAEARFLRAWYYHHLLKYFGGVPIVGGQVFTTGDDAGLNRSTYEECIEYLVKELDEITSVLPGKNHYLGTREYGRITRGAAMALKSRILLSAASPLFNGNSTAPDGSELEKIVSYPDFEQSRWERAMQAAKAVMNLNVYSLMVDNATEPGYGFYNVFLTRVNDEFIFSRQIAPGKTRERDNFPRSRGGKRHLRYPTQELVDKFPMINGKPINDPASGYSETDPYANRDPRFGYTIIYNTSLLYLNTAKALAPVYTYLGAPQDGIVPVTSAAATVNGYYTRKGCNELSAITGGGRNQGVLPLIRYAEILLNYAEAANELGNTGIAIEQLKALRHRAGIQPGPDQLYGLPANPSTAEARLLIQNERAIELAFEEHRLWDIRRWRLGDLIDDKFSTGMEITKVTDGKPGPGTVYTYKRIPVRKRYFKTETYLFPIPQTEIALNRGILQNPGW